MRSRILLAGLLWGAPLVAQRDVVHVTVAVNPTAALQEGPTITTENLLADPNTRELLRNGFRRICSPIPTPVNCSGMDSRRVFTFVSSSGAKTAYSTIALDLQNGKSSFSRIRRQKRTARCADKETA